MKKFALLGVAGFVAPRHLNAIKQNNAKLIAAVDTHDSVGILDSYFPEAHFFTEFERFDRHLDKLRRSGDEYKVDYVSICSPNYLHDSHIRHGLRSGCDVICEKPLVLTPKNLTSLIELEHETNKKVNAILQLRLHPEITALKKQEKSEKRKQISLTYVTSRGNWYLRSWKGSDEKSGGVVTNIGIHFFDMLQWVFGDVKASQVHYLTDYKASGFIELADADVQWFLSIDEKDLPEEVKNKGQRTFRNIDVDGKAIEFSDGFTDLHTETYKQILVGNGFGIEDARPSIELVHAIRNAKKQLSDSYHPFLKRTNHV